MWISKVLCLVVLVTVTRAQEDSILQTAAKFIGSCGEKNLMLCLKVSFFFLFADSNPNIKAKIPFA